MLLGIGVHSSYSVNQIFDSVSMYVCMLMGVHYTSMGAHHTSMVHALNLLVPCQRCV